MNLRQAYRSRVLNVFILASVALLVGATVFFLVFRTRGVANIVADPPGAFEFPFAAGLKDASGHFLGGTEMRVLAAHDGKLFAGNGYWEDRPGPEGLQNAGIFVLDRPGADWSVDHVFNELLPNGRPRNLAVSALTELRFATDGAGAKLSSPVSMLAATTWDLTGDARVFTRNDATGVWFAGTLAHNARTPGDRHLPQVRSIGAHRDRVTGVDHVFAGQDPRGIFRGVYDPAEPSRIRWSSSPELDISALSTADFPGLEGKLRISSFAECNGLFYAAAGQQIYERVDGPAPSWRLIYSNPRPGYSETGLRGLTTVAAPSGGEALLAAVEGKAARIVRIDPRDGREETELDLVDFLTKSWGMRVAYVIAAYNDMTPARDPQGNRVVLAGLEAFIAPGVPAASGHDLVDVGYGRLEAGAWFLVRRSAGDYDLRRIAARPGDPRPMVATRSVLLSPFEREDAIYFSGYDANKSAAHNTAWIARASTAVAIGPAP